MDVEQEGCLDIISSSWRSKHHSQHQQWLQSALSELDRGTREMLSMMNQDDDGGGDSFARRAEMYYQRRPDHLRRLRLLRRTFHSLFASLAAAATAQPTPLRHRSSFHSYSNSDPRRSTTTTTTGTEYSRTSSTSSADHEEEVEEEGGPLEEVGRIMGELARRNTEKREEKKELEAKVERLERENAELRKLLEEGARTKKEVVSGVQSQQRVRESVEGTTVDCTVCSGLVRRRRRSSPVQKIKQLIFGEH